MSVARLSAPCLLGFVLGFVACGDGGSSDCQPGTQLCACVDNLCLGGLECVAGYCVSLDDETSESGDGDPGDGDGDGDGDGTPGDGDGSTGDGDGGPGDGDGGPGDGDGTPGDGDGDACGFALTLTPPNVMFVLDASGSMVNVQWDHDQNPNTPVVTRWSSLHASLSPALTQYGPLINAGVKRFPSATATSTYDAMACTTNNVPEDTIAFDNGAGILAAIPPQNATNSQVRGGTPATVGIETAVDHLLQQPSDRYAAIVFVSDGAPNCNLSIACPMCLEVLDANLVPAVSDAYVLGISTFAIGVDITNGISGVGVDGVPEANPYLVLNDVATAGGEPNVGNTKFHDGDNQALLDAAFTTVLDQIACTVSLAALPEGPPTPQDLPGLAFTLNGAPVPVVGDCMGGDGWSWVTQGEILRFCGSTCDAYKAAPGTFETNYCG